jgi:hypothetical protein
MLLHRSSGVRVTPDSLRVTAVSPLFWRGSGALGIRARERVHGGGDEGVVDPDAALVAGEDPGVDEDLEVAGDGRLGQAEQQHHPYGGMRGWHTRWRVRHNSPAGVRSGAVRSG